MVKRKYIKIASFRGFTLHKFQSRQGRGLKWFWQLRGRNGRVTSDHQQGYNNEADMIGILERMFDIEIG